MLQNSKAMIDMKVCDALTALYKWCLLFLKDLGLTKVISENFQNSVFPLQTNLKVSFKCNLMLNKKLLLSLSTEIEKSWCVFWINKYMNFQIYS